MPPGTARQGCFLSVSLADLGFCFQVGFAVLFGFAAHEPDSEQPEDDYRTEDVFCFS